MDYALKLESVSKKYKGFSLHDVNIELPRGYIMGFIGENGAGKSTTIKLILDIVKRDSGEIYVLGQNNNKNFNDIKEKIGYVADESSFPENLCPRNIDLILKNIYKNWDSKQFLQYLSRFSLPEKKPCGKFSKGMKMKLSIAAALSHHPQLLILDEAISGLDPIMRDEILEVFAEFVQDERHSVFISSHILSDLEKICDYICFIHKGSIILCEEKDTMLDKYGVLKCSAEEFSKLDKSAVKGFKQNTFGVEALVLRNKIKNGKVLERASIEDIMIYQIKGDKK